MPAPPDRATIFALSSGRPPAAIAVVRISGPRARDALAALTPKFPEPRRAALRRLRESESQIVLDDALVLWLPGPNTETGEDMVELHLHGGRAVIAAVLAALHETQAAQAAQAVQDVALGGAGGLRQAREAGAGLAGQDLHHRTADVVAKHREEAAGAVHPRGRQAQRLSGRPDGLQPQPAVTPRLGPRLPAATGTQSGDRHGVCLSPRRSCAQLNVRKV